jgi:hypothetical protein
MMSDKDIRAAVVVGTIVLFLLIGLILIFLEDHTGWSLRKALRKAKSGTKAEWNMVKKGERETAKKVEEALSTWLFNAALLGCRMDIVKSVFRVEATILPPYQWLCPEIGEQFRIIIEDESDGIKTQRKILKERIHDLRTVLKSEPGKGLAASKRQLRISYLRSSITDLTTTFQNRGDQWQKKLRDGIQVDKKRFATVSLLKHGTEVGGSAEGPKSRILLQLQDRYYVLVLTEKMEVSISSLKENSIADVLNDITNFNSDERERVRKDIERIQEERKAA